MIKKIALLGIIVLFTVLFIYCTTDESTIIGPFGNADKYISVANFSANKTLLYSNGDSTIVSIKVLDVDKAPVIGLIVNFSAQFGSITESDITDSSGIALATFVSDDNIGENIITANTGAKKYELYLHVLNYQLKYVPAYVVINSDVQTLLADGISEVGIIAKAYDSANNVIPGAVFDFSTTIGSLNKTTSVMTNQEGNAIVTLQSAGSMIDTFAIVKAIATSDTSISEDVNIELRGITSFTYIDSAKMTDNGIYRAYLRTNLLETTSGANISSGAVRFYPPEGIGKMVTSLVPVEDNGTAVAIFEADVLQTNQNDISIKSELSATAEVFSMSSEFDIPGAEMLINTVDDEVMGDGIGYALVKATLREINGKAITETSVGWETTLGTIKGKSTTNTIGHTIDTLAIEYSVNQDTDVKITANYGDNISISEIITFIPPINDSDRLILGFEPDTTGHGIIPCDIDTSLAVREIGISALYSRGSWYRINFSVVPNNLAVICPMGVTSGAEGLANVMMVYPPQNTGQVVRVWAKTPYARGSIDVVLP